MNYLNANILISLLVIWIFTSFFAGLYPAFVLSSFKITTTLKGSKGNSTKGGIFRKILVVIQFALSTGLIICSLVVSNQLEFLKNKDLGFEKENMIYIPVQGKMMEKYDLIKQFLVKYPMWTDACRSSHSAPFSVGSYGGGWDWEGKGPDVRPLVGFMMADFDFPKTFKINMLEGRFFSSEFSSDTDSNFEGNLNVVINTTFADIIGK